MKAIDEHGVLILLDRSHDETRDLTAHAPDDVGEELDGDTLKGADDESAPCAGGDIGNLLARGVEAVEDHFGVAQQGPTDRGEDDWFRPAGALEHRAAHESLEAGDLLADGRLGVAEDVGGPPEGPLLGYGAQCFEVSYLVARGAEWHDISINDRHDENSSLYVMESATYSQCVGTSHRRHRARARTEHTKEQS